MFFSVAPKKFKFDITRLVVIVELALLGIGILWMLIRKIPVTGRIKISPLALQIGLGAGILFLLSSTIFYLIDKKFFEGLIGKIMERDIYPIFSKVTFPQILLIAFLSGFCEEFFFRGVLMAETGILVSSLIFGILHTPSQKAWFMGVWTALAGVAFALLYKITGNLFIPMVAHMLNNLVAISYARYLHPMLNREKSLVRVDAEKPVPRENQPTEINVVEKQPKPVKAEKPMKIVKKEEVKPPAKLKAGSQVQILGPEMVKEARKITEKFEKAKQGIIPDPNYKPLPRFEDSREDIETDSPDKYEKEIEELMKDTKKKDENKKEKKDKKETSIPPNRKASDTDDEGIGIVHKPQ
ncbi:MAG: type II CAAX prenyl endopeptidase Rce1 family protein [Vulcanimicrobiota bacterium]